VSSKILPGLLTSRISSTGYAHLYGISHFVRDFDTCGNVFQLEFRGHWLQYLSNWVMSILYAPVSSFPVSQALVLCSFAPAETIEALRPDAFRREFKPIWAVVMDYRSNVALPVWRTSTLTYDAVTTDSNSHQQRPLACRRLASRITRSLDFLFSVSTLHLHVFGDNTLPSHLIDS
jgi:hypothetical protein